MRCLLIVLLLAGCASKPIDYSDDVVEISSTNALLIPGLTDFIKDHGIECADDAGRLIVEDAASKKKYYVCVP
jgi:hypothetical protein